MSKKPMITPPPPVTFTVDDIDHFNDQIRRASYLTLLTIKALEADNVLITQDSEDEDGLTEAVSASLSQVRETLQTLHTFMNGRWADIRQATQAGAR